MTHRSALAGFAVVALAGAAALAAPIIDQEQVNTDTTFTLAIGGTSTQKLAQVFTAGATGKLTYVTVPVECQPSAVLTVNIEKVSSGVPVGSILAQEVLAGTAFPVITPSPDVGSRIVRFTNPASIFSGTQYAIVLSAEKDSCGLFVGPLGDTYTSGTAYFDALPNPPGWIAISPVRDLAFQTFVE